MEYKNPASTIDVIVVKEDKVLLVKRKHPPFKRSWALPGGYLKYGKETLYQTAVRELREETNLIVSESDLELLGVYSDPGRDPRGHVISHVYIARKFSGVLKAGDDAQETSFFPINKLPKLAFDHDKILKDYLVKLNKRELK